MNAAGSRLPLILATPHLVQFSQLVSETLCFLWNPVRFSHCILRWIILDGSLRPSFSRRIGRSSVCSEMEGGRTSGPERVGSATSIERISDGSASTQSSF